MRNYLRIRPQRDPQAGMTILETTIAMGILMALTAGLMVLSTTAAITTENQGHLVARATEYAQDKIEQLIALPMCDGAAPGDAFTGTNTTVWPPTVGGGTGLETGGSANPDTPVAGYVDYLNFSGDLMGGGVTPPAGWFYKRVWRVSLLAGCVNPPDPCLAPATPTCFQKQITVTASVRRGVGGQLSGNFSNSTVTTVKTYPF